MIDDTAGGVAEVDVGGEAPFATGDEPDSEKITRAMALFAALTAIGANLSDDWSDLAARGMGPLDQPVDGPLVLALHETAAAKRPGEALLLAAALIGERPLKALTAIEVDAVLRNLRAIGLAEEARLLGIDIALANAY